MIGKLSGIIDSIHDKHLVLDVQGVGYLINASIGTLRNIGQAGDTASLLIETQVREDAITLYGFREAAEQKWFRLLTSVQGVGAKAALSILTVCLPEKLGVAIAAQDKAALTQADGVGPKLAARILTELKDKAAEIELAAPGAGKAGPGAPGGGAADGLNGDAVSALVNLGYARSEAYTAVINAAPRANDNLQTLIKEALKELSG